MKPCIFLPQPSNFFLKKILIVAKKKAFSYISEKRNPALFSLSSKNKKIHSEKISCILGNETHEKFIYIFGGNLQSLKIKNF